jgi:hypothetical protein
MMVSMTMRTMQLGFLLLLLTISHAASAQSTLSAQDNRLIGTWHEQLKLGSIVVVFTEWTMTFSRADASGQVIPNSAHVAHVHYRDLGKTIGIEFDEEGGGEILATPRSTTHIVLDFPGGDTHQLDKAN